MDRLISLGLDVGTTTTQLILSELTVETGAMPFLYPKWPLATVRSYTKAR